MNRGCLCIKHELDPFAFSIKYRLVIVGQTDGQTYWAVAAEKVWRRADKMTSTLRNRNFHVIHDVIGNIIVRCFAFVKASTIFFGKTKIKVRR